MNCRSRRNKRPGSRCRRCRARHPPGPAEKIVVTRPALKGDKKRADKLKGDMSAAKGRAAIVAELATAFREGIEAAEASLKFRERHARAKAAEDGGQSTGPDSPAARRRLPR
jgi:hypothetical protein